MIPLIPPYPSAVPDAYSLEIQIYRGYWMVSWFKSEFGHHEQRLADERGITPEELFDELVRVVPPGSDGLVLQPYWSPGLKMPGPEARGAIIGFGGAAYARASLSRDPGRAGVCAARRSRTHRRSAAAYRLRNCAWRAAAVKAIRRCRSQRMCLACLPHVHILYEASGLGAAIDAAVGLKLHPDFDTAIKEMTRLGDTFEPNSQAHAIYEEIYRNVYGKMYGRLKPLYEALRKIGR